MISSILISDFISTRLMGQGISLKKWKTISLHIDSDIKCLQGRILMLMSKHRLADIEICV